jgi:hypothetical protein
MNPAAMGSGALSAPEALHAVDTELSGTHRGRLVLGFKKPDQSILKKASSHRQVVDFWLVHIARDQGAKLATRDAGTITHWQEQTVAIIAKGG